MPVNSDHSSEFSEIDVMPLTSSQELEVGSCMDECCATPSLTDCSEFHVQPPTASLAVEIGSCSSEFSEFDENPRTHVKTPENEAESCHIEVGFQICRDIDNTSKYDSDETTFDPFEETYGQRWE